MADKKIDNIDLEEAMKRLDKITDELSKEGVKLEDALGLYEEGVKLVRLCNKKLDDTERKIKMLRMQRAYESMNNVMQTNSTTLQKTITSVGKAIG